MKPEKCKFEQKHIKYLGLVISKDHIGMYPAKVQGVLNWPMPHAVRDVHSFLGFTNFYRCFISNFLEITRPLNALTHKSRKWS